MVDIRHDLSSMYLAPVADASAEEVEQAFSRLEEQGLKLLSDEGVTEDRIRLERSIAMRYLGQWRSMKVRAGSPVDLDAAVAQFHDDHEREYSYRRDDAPVELYRLELAAIGATDEVRLPGGDVDGAAAMPAPAHTRPVHFDGHDAPLDTPVYDRASLPAGVRFDGPAVIDQLDSTTLVPPGARAEVDTQLNIRMHLDLQEDQA